MESEEALEFVDILLVASMPVLRVFLLGALGAFLTTSYVGLFPKEARNHLNKLLFAVFAPTLLFSNLVQAVSFENLKSWWFLPINVVLTFVIGGALGHLIAKVLEPDPYLQRLTIACCSTANVGNLPLLLIPALCMEPTSPFKNREVCVKNGMAYVSFTLATATLVQWTYTYNLLKPKPSENKSINPSPINTNNAEELALINTCNQEPLDDSHWNMSPISTSSFCGGYLWKKIKDYLGSIPWRDIANPPIISVVFAVFIGTIPPFKRLLIGKEAPLRVVEDAMATIGGAMLPSLILLLGGNLYQGVGSAKIKGKVVAAIVIAKLLLVPLGGVLIVQTIVRLGWTPPDPLYQLILYMHYAMPSAMNIGIMTQLFGASNDSSLVLFWCYLVSILTITLWTIMYINLIF